MSLCRVPHTPFLNTTPYLLLFSSATVYLRYQSCSNVSPPLYPTPLLPPNRQPPPPPARQPASQHWCLGSFTWLKEGKVK